MQVHRTEFHEVDASKLKVEHRPGPKHYDVVLKPPCEIFVDGERVALSLPVREIAKEGEYAELLSALRGIKYGTSNRTNGLISQSRVFGYSPRVTIRRDYCMRASMGREHPHAHEMLMEWGRKSAAMYQAANPELYAKHIAEVEERVKSCWRIEGTPWTSGICNKDNALGFHHDAGNFPGYWATMYAFARDIEGGYLVLPEARVAIDFGEVPSIIAFANERLLHGVTRIRKRSSLGFRYSVVYYSLVGLCKCGTPKEELRRIRRVKTERERVRLDKDALLQRKRGKKK